MNNDGLDVLVGVCIVVFIITVVGLFYVSEQILKIFGGV